MLKRPVTVADTQVQCDPNCHESSGCSERGEGKCDSECVDGYSVNRKTFTCMSNTPITCHVLASANKRL